jgi:hypothetical protein
MASQDDVGPAPTGRSLDAGLKPLVLFTTFVGVVLGAVESFTRLISSLESKWLYLTTTALYLVTISLCIRFRLSALVKTRVSDTRARYAILVLATVAYGICMVWPYYEYNHSETTSPARPQIRLSLLEGTAFAAKSPNPTLRLEQFYLNDDLCSFNELETPLFAESAAKVRTRTFAFDMSVNEAFRRGGCIGPTGEKPIEGVLPLLRARIERLGLSNLARYIEKPRDLSRVTRERGDIFEKIIFTSEEVLAMKAAAPTDYQKVKSWLLDCVGVAQPVFTLVVRNSGKDSVLLQAVEYNVVEVGQVRGSVTGPIYPEITYDHPLKHQKGTQRHQLKPPLNIAPGTTTSFNLRLIPTSEEPGLAWFMSIKVIGSQGDSLETDRFQLIMSK